MGFIEKLSNLLRGETDGYVSSGTNEPTKSGSRVTHSDAITDITIRAGVRALAEDIASVPRHLYRRVDGSKMRADDHWMYRLFRDDPNPRMTGVEYRELEMYNLVTWGNHFAYIEMDAVLGIVPVALWPLRPDRMSIIVQPNGMRTYVYMAPDGKTDVFTEREIVHVMGLSSDGYIGQSVFTIHAETIGLHLAMRDYTALQFSQGGLDGGFIIHPADLSDDAIRKLQQRLNDTAGNLSAHRWRVLREDMKIAQITGRSASETQLIEARKFGILEVAQMLRMPPDKLGDLTRATLNLEEQGTNYVMYSLRPWVVRIESAYNKRLIGPHGREAGLFLEHNLDGLMRGDIEKRYTAYATARQWGWMSANKILEKENEPGIGPAGDKYLTPLNMVDAAGGGSASPPTSPASSSVPDSTPPT